ncbi:16S rRNA (uracil(1498)-N(3))-methyltransferase [Prosthecomicrobium pneumaticum]|uniref:Ribosomal RNA small subunit methyltransferase E n=1 Tax=Prosthecomicrobium pneumaticum TaxID=81895 RepID=A0A7W9CVF5_9HYPH|nr:16S rRNA (uracil(1498)-N(3))-methyltransferase [Prosthecomicrobium pneumaticum]MBB5752313.1 16S rRNA (uracil1498-N3)-methyltransferase [Prosthecomicrobium pneumaticum]
MSRYDFTSQRLFLDADLAIGATLPLDRDQANYLVTVLRMRPGESLLVFNGRDGEWRAVLEGDRKRAALTIGERTRPQTPPAVLDYLFAPLKQGRLDYMVQKAVEMGAGRLRPVITQHTQVPKLNPERLRANAIEAAEQCGILSLPAIDPPRPLLDVVAEWPMAMPLVFCDENEAGDPLAVLSRLTDGPLGVLIGPEGGFSAEERDRLRRLPFVVPIALGPRILRADTAAVAALALVQAAKGDWRGS